MLGRFTKWGPSPHWEWDGRFLGSDEHGLWWFAPSGTFCSRPGVAFTEEVPWVSMTPHAGGFAASFYPSPKPVAVYVDMTTPPTWTRTAQGEWTVAMVDLDLDVVLARDGRLYVDDEDEFAEHRVRLGYPPAVVALAERTAREVLAAIEAGREPFGSVGLAWLRQVTG